MIRSLLTWLDRRIDARIEARCAADDRRIRAAIEAANEAARSFHDKALRNQKTLESLR